MGMIDRSIIPMYLGITSQATIQPEGYGWTDYMNPLGAKPVCILWDMSCVSWTTHLHYSDVIMIAIASQITSPTIVYSTVYSGADERKDRRSASLALCGWPVTGEFPTQKASYAENVSISWRHHGAEICKHREAQYTSIDCITPGFPSSRRADNVPLILPNGIMQCI